MSLTIRTIVAMSVLAAWLTASVAFGAEPECGRCGHRHGACQSSEVRKDCGECGLLGCLGRLCQGLGITCRKPAPAVEPGVAALPIEGPLPPFEEDGRVSLFDGGVPLAPDQIVITTGTLLRSPAFHERVVSEVQSRYYGYLIGHTREDDRYVLTGPAYGFTARYGQTATTGWPDATTFIYEDSRNQAASLSRVQGAEDLPESDNLRIYHYPARVGFEGGQYQTQDTLIIAYIDPDSGRRSSYLYRPVDGRYDLYRLIASRIPTEPSEASVVSVMGVATTDTIELRLLLLAINVDVPRNTFSARVYRLFGGRSYEGTESPLGPPVQFTGLAREQYLSPFEAALEAHRAGQAMSAEEFQRAYQLIRQAHRYLAEGQGQ